MIGNLLFIAVWLVLASALNIAVSGRIAMGPGFPDFALIVAVILATRVQYESAAVIGFFLGIFHSSAINDKRFAFVLAGIAACMTGTKICSRSVEATPMTIAIVVIICTVLSRTILLFVGLPTNPTNIFPWLPATMATATYNGAIAVPIYLLIRRLSQTLFRV